jgi:hypothetical protein
MEYNFLANFLAKFSSLTPWIQGIIILSTSAIPICFFYFINHTIIKTLELFTVKNIYKGAIEEKIKDISVLFDKFINGYLPVK